MYDSNGGAMRKHKGVSLVEVLVGLAIGLVILIAVGTAYLNSTNTARQRENQAELNDPARVVMQMLRRDISMAGYVDILDMDSIGSTQAASLFISGNAIADNIYRRVPAGAPIEAPMGQFFPGLMPVFGCDGAMNSNPATIAAAATTVLACGAANPTRQTLQVAYQAIPSGTPFAITGLLPQSPVTGEGRDCSQQTLPATAAAHGGKFVINRYFVQASPGDGINELYCFGSGGVNAQPIARGVEEFVLRYQTAINGVAPPIGTPPTAAGAGQAQYVDAATVAASALGWANVTAVEVCIVSATAVSGGVAAQGTTVLQTTRPTCARAANGSFAANIPRVAGDARLWKRFTSVVSARNAVISSIN
jgi:type IV pilus assembly protein PilW